MTFSYKDSEKLKKRCIHALRKAGHKAENTNERKRIRKRFAKPDDSKIRVKSGDSDSYIKWVETHNGIESLAANPDLFEDDINRTDD